jgi:serine/threonine protein kinase
VQGWTVPGYADGPELGTTARGRSVLGRHLGSGAPVVIRFLAVDLPVDVYRELARRLAAVSSPSVAALYEYVEGDHGVAVVREYVAGVPLSRLTGQLRPRAALTVLKGGLRGLVAIGGPHGAYRASNLLLTPDGEVKLSDPDPAAGLKDAPLDVMAETMSRTDRRLRWVLPALAAVDPAALLEELEAAAARAYGPGWEADGRSGLIKFVRRAVSRR